MRNTNKLVYPRNHVASAEAKRDKPTAVDRYIKGMEISGSPFAWDDKISQRANDFMTKVARLANFLDQVTQRVNQVILRVIQNFQRRVERFWTCIHMTLKWNIYGIPEGTSTLFTIYFYLLRFTSYHLLFYLLLHAILRFTIYHLLFTTYFFRFTIDHLLFTTYYFTSYHLHFTIYHFQSTSIYIIFYLLPPSIQYLPSWFYYLPFPIFFYFYFLPSSI